MIESISLEEYLETHSNDIIRPHPNEIFIFTETPKINFEPGEDTIILSPSYHSYDFTGYQIVNDQIVFEYGGELSNYTNEYGMQFGRVYLPAGLDIQDVESSIKIDDNIYTLFDGDSDGDDESDNQEEEFDSDEELSDIGSELSEESYISDSD